MLEDIFLKNLLCRPCRTAFKDFRLGPVRWVIDHHDQRGVFSPVVKPVVL